MPLCRSAVLIQREGFVTTRTLLQSVVSACVLWEKDSSADVFILVEKQGVQEILYLFPARHITNLSYIAVALSSPDF